MVETLNHLISRYLKWIAFARQFFSLSSFSSFIVIAVVFKYCGFIGMLDIFQPVFVDYYELDYFRTFEEWNIGQNVEHFLKFVIPMFQLKKPQVSARACEGGHRCSPPKECCAQGCCYLYAPPSAPKAQLPNNTSHVLNLFFINHWFFW